MLEQGCPGLEESKEEGKYKKAALRDVRPNQAGLCSWCSSEWMEN
jgi:hypothetical protein